MKALKAARSAALTNPPRVTVGSQGAQPEIVQKRTKEILKGLKTILWAHGAGSRIIKDAAQQCYEYLETGSPSESVWFKRAKYMLVLPMSLYLRRRSTANDLPKQPDGSSFKPTGPFGTWCRNRLRLFKASNTHLWYSWLQGKRCSLPVDPSVVEQTYKEHFESLTRADPLSVV